MKCFMFRNTSCCLSLAIQTRGIIIFLTCGRQWWQLQHPASVNPKSELKLGTKVFTSRLEQWLLVWLLHLRTFALLWGRTHRWISYVFSQWSCKSERKILRVSAACFCWMWRMLLRFIIFYTILKLYMWIQYCYNQVVWSVKGNTWFFEAGPKAH